MMANGTLLRRLREGVLIILACSGLVLGLDQLFPLDMSRAQQMGRVIVDHAGNPLRYLATRDGYWRIPAAPETVSPLYLDLLLAYEDQRFYDHWGVDPIAVLRALSSNVKAGRIVSGASTVTMQVARLLNPGEKRGWISKIKQTLRALQLEAHYSKRDILAFYLSLAPFGGPIEGVHMASQIYFGSKPDTLDLSQSALLIALTQSPTRRRPFKYAANATHARNLVIDTLVQRGTIDAGQAAAAKLTSIPQKPVPLPFMSPQIAGNLGWQSQTPLVRTTLDAVLQKRIENLAGREAMWFEDHATMAVIVVDIKSRSILAAQSGHDFKSAQGEVDLSKALRSPGSTLKPFIYALAFDKGLVHPDTVLKDQPTRFGDYLPRNFDRHFQGFVTARDALAQSLNVPAVTMLEGIGAHQFQTHLTDAGVAIQLPKGRHEAGLALALGGIGISLRDLAGLYTALARDGMYSPLRLQPDQPLTNGYPLMSKQASLQIMDILSHAPRPAGVFGGQNENGHRIAYKTGTSFGFRDALSIGYDKEHVVAVWVGRADGTPRPGFYGRNTAAPIMFHVFDLLNNQSSQDATDGEMLALNQDHSPPLGLRQFNRATEREQGSEKPRILFPPHKSEITLSSLSNSIVTLDGRGVLPLRWYVNGEPLSTNAYALQAEWMPLTPGFYTISVVDASGKSTKVQARIIESP
jgi:penicillin-binding protein 1C